MQDLDETSLKKDNLKKNPSKLGKLEMLFLGLGGAIGGFVATSTDLHWDNIIGISLDMLQNNYTLLAAPLAVTIADYGIQKLKHNPIKLFSSRYLKALGASTLGDAIGGAGGLYVNSLFDFGGLSGLNVTFW